MSFSRWASHHNRSYGDTFEQYGDFCHLRQSALFQKMFLKKINTKSTDIPDILTNITEHDVFHCCYSSDWWSHAIPKSGACYDTATEGVCIEQFSSNTTLIFMCIYNII